MGFENASITCKSFLELCRQGIYPNKFYHDKDKSQVVQLDKIVVQDL
ncbi:20838_t:CDS:1, partial [Gigaspora rosea]